MKSAFNAQPVKTAFTILTVPIIDIEYQKLLNILTPILEQIKRTKDGHKILILSRKANHYVYISHLTNNTKKVLNYYIKMVASITLINAEFAPTKIYCSVIPKIK